MGSRGTKSSIKRDGHNFYSSGSMTNKSSAKKEAERIRSKGGNARVVKYKNGYQCYGRS